MRSMNTAIVSAGLLAASLGLSCALAAQETAAPVPPTGAAPPAVALSATAAPSAAAAPASATPPAPAAHDEATAPPRAGAHPQAKGGKPSDTIELDTTDITGNRELPKVMYIVPWKHSDLGDLTGKPLNSLVDEALQPVDRDVFKRENRYYGAVAGADGAPPTAAPSAAAHSSAHGAGGGQAPAARDER
ncbi:MAG TPA: hypothetical protein VMU67_06790 [Steroidobacteraceae bacterium]|nr:hypothetical protein [Steroidobacteraceae bacterium]